MKIILSLIILFLFASCYNREGKVDKEKLVGSDFRLFQNTPAWDLAKAVEDQDTGTIKRMLANGKLEPDFQEPKFGNTLLMLAVENSKFESVKTLLDVGASPNAVNFYRGTSAMIDAASHDDPKYLKLLLSHNGNPNALESAPVKENDKARNTPLNTAITLSNTNALEKVKLLVDAGADINYFNDGNPSYTSLPLSDALIQERLDVALYLLEKGADFNKVMYTTVNGRKVYILEALRKVVVDLDSDEYKKKLKIINFLRARGLNYHKEPIPDYIVKDIKEKYPNQYEEYLKVY